MPSEDEYSEAEESASDEEEEVKSGEDAEDYDEHSDEGSRLDEDENKKKTKTMAKAGMKEGEQSVLESISTEVPIRGPDDKVFVFGRSIKKRVKPFPRAFDVEYRLLQPAEHSDSTANGCKVLRTVAQIKEFLQQNELPADAIAEFDFSQRYGENGELTEFGRKQAAATCKAKGRARGGKRKGGRLVPAKAKKQKIETAYIKGGPSSNHPLSRCVQILYDVMSNKEAQLFNKPVQAKHAPGYFEKISEPRDLGTIFSNLKSGIYSTAHAVRKDVTLVWKNCLTYNGPDSDITHYAEFLAQEFDTMFDEYITAPRHLGMTSFKQGVEWIGKEVECYWKDDFEWYSGIIAGYDPEQKNEQGLRTPYKIKYKSDDTDEWMDLPSKDVAILDWEGMADEMESWEGFVAPIKGSAARAQRSRTTTKHFAPIPGPAGRGRVCGKRGRPMPASATADAEDDDELVGDGGAAVPANNEAEAVRADGEKLASDFICDDGLPCGEVCRCRLLFWCRFKLRKGMVMAPKGSSKGLGAKVDRCSYTNCPHPTISSNDRWHFISQHTASGGRDWSELMGQTLCSSCFQQYRGKGTLVRQRDSLY